MRILIDECIPKRFARELSGYEILTVQESGWLGKKNGELLKLLAENNFDVFVTVDQNFQYQQNLKDTRVAIIVLSASSNRYEDLKPLGASVHKILADIVSGKIYIITE